MTNGKALNSVYVGVHAIVRINFNTFLEYEVNVIEEKAPSVANIMMIADKSIPSTDHHITNPSSSSFIYHANVFQIRTTITDNIILIQIK